VPQFAVKFLSGKYQGGEFPLPDEGEVLIGRASDLDMVLVEDMVSRKHAKLMVSAGKVQIMDLGSTNGTFVNGKKVTRAPIKLGDRVLVGTNILKLIGANEMAAGPSTSKEKAKAQMEGIAAAAPQSASMSGELEDVPLPDLLQLFASNQKSGTLTVSGAFRGKLLIKGGQLITAVIAGELTMPPMKAFCRMVTWHSGHFDLEPGEPTESPPNKFTEATESILLEAMRQADELNRIVRELPPPVALLHLCAPLVPQLRSLSPEELDVLQMIVNYKKVHAIVDRSPKTDYETFVTIHKLLSQQYVEVEK
jgi:hypothetical protein